MVKHDYLITIRCAAAVWPILHILIDIYLINVSPSSFPHPLPGGYLTFRVDSPRGAG